ncbi:hypothetical protein A0O28_0091220 [Trichoderma guizhouense]|uniref:CHAT domain-containing protein n=1 Tax=Trichoderma guizhouense TaxID=1491466 RepID=A0A1T3CV72_9HYPO|nr:hypothetical protein A0O28_0091220 [Trichoderma guizhouense]
MDVVYVRQSGRPNEVAGLDRRRSWDVTIQVNKQPEVSVTITDPFLEAEYKDIFEDYLRNSDRQHWSLKSLELEDSGTDGVSSAENRIHAYGEILLAQLGLLQPRVLRPGSTEVQLVVVEHYDSHEDEKSINKAGGIHCLAWELLESVSVRSPLMRNLRLRVTRVSDFASQPTRPLGPPRSLSSVQVNPNSSFYVLLVIARDFSRSGADRDPEPDLAQWPLMNVQKKLRSRLLLEVVRPGSIEELDEHLKVRASHGVQFNLVHFDLHGRIMDDEYGRQVPWLLFAKKPLGLSSHVNQVPQTHLAKASDVAKVLADYHVENVVLNACLSAYNRSGPSTNLAHIFLERGVHNVSAMWFYVHWQTVATYLEAFYNELLIKGTDFHVAAQRGRDAIQKNPTKRTGQPYQDFFLCVNYTRDVRRPATIHREPSPTPSAHSAESSTSNTSMKSFMSGKWRPSTPRLSDSFLIGDEPIMRLQLHLLELEYKLMTSRVVYASDLRRSGSDLNATIEKMVTMWLNTNLVDDVYYYKAKDFARRKTLTGSVPYREKRSRASSGGYLQLLFPRPVRALRQTLHIVRDVDSVVDPGWQADDVENQRSEERRSQVQDGLVKFVEKLERHSYLLFIGSQDAQWYRTYLQYLQGEWWLHMPWTFTVHSRYVRDVVTEKRKQIPRTIM